MRRKSRLKKFKQWLCGIFGHHWYPFLGEKHYKICILCGKKKGDEGYMRSVRKDKK
jgi:hypothetical protein